MALKQAARLLLLAALLAGACTPPPTPPPPTPIPTATPTPTVPPTRTPTPTPTPTPTSTPTVTPVRAGTPLPPPPDSILEITLPRLAELARWGRGQIQDLVDDGRSLWAATALGIYRYAGDLSLQTVLESGPTALLALSPDGKILAAGAGPLQNGALSIWETGSGRRLGTLEVDPAGLALAFSLDGGSLALLSQTPDGVRLTRWSVETWTRQGEAVILKSPLAPSRAAISPDLSTAVTIDRTGLVQLWRTSDGAAVTSLLPGPQPATLLAFSPDGARLAVGYADQVVDYRNDNALQVISIPDGGLLYTLFSAGGVEGAWESLLSIAWSPDGTLLAAGYADRSARVWKAEPSAPFRTLSGRGYPTRLAFSPRGDTLAGGGLDLWGLADGTLRATQPDHLPPFLDMALSPDGTRAALAGNGEIQIRSVPDGALLQSITGFDGPVSSLSISPDGLLLAGGCAEGRVRLWRMSDGRLLTVYAAGARVWAVAFSRDGQLLAAASEDARTRFFEIITNRLVLNLGEPYLATRLVFSPDGIRYAALTSSGVNLRFIEQGTLNRAVSGIGLEDVAFSIDGVNMAVSGYETLRAVDLNTGQDVFRLYEGPMPASGGPGALAYSPDGAFLAVAWPDRLEIRWAGDGSLMRTLPGQPGSPSRRMAFTSDSRYLLASVQDGTVRVYGIAP